MHTDMEKEHTRLTLADKFQDTTVVTAMPTPMNTDGTVDYDAVELLARHLCKHGTDGILVGGSTGEEAMLNHNEKRRIVEIVKKTLTARDGSRKTKLFVGTGSSSTKTTLEETKWAAQIGADAAVVIVPPQVKPNEDGLKFHFGAVAKADPSLPIIIYNIPSRTGTNMQPEIVAELAQRHPNIIGIKQSYKDMKQIEKLKKLCPKGFLIYSGDDDLTLEMLKRGAHGVISVASNIDNEAIKQMVIAHKKGRATEAQQANEMLTPLYKACFVTTNPIPVKYLLSEYTAPWMTATLRPPLVAMNQDDHQKMVGLFYEYRCNKANRLDFLNTIRDKQNG